MYQIINKTCVYPLSNFSLVSERQQVDVWLQRAGVNHSLVPEKHNIDGIITGELQIRTELNLNFNSVIVGTD